MHVHQKTLINMLQKIEIWLKKKHMIFQKHVYIL